MAQSNILIFDIYPYVNEKLVRQFRTAYVKRKPQSVREAKHYWAESKTFKNHKKKQ